VIDHQVVPSKLSRHNADKYKKGTVEFRSFPGRSHFPGAAGWEEVPDYALSWTVAHAAEPKRVTGSG
jgi:non-heme chloroperoxidase